MTDLVNPKDFQARVQEHVRNTFGTLITDDELNKLVNKEMMDFFNTPTEIKFNVTKHSWGQDYKVEMVCPATPFKQLIWTTMMPLAMERLKVYFEHDGGQYLTKLLDELIVPLPKDENLKDIHNKKLDQILDQMTRNLFSDLIRAAITETRKSIANSLMSGNMPDVAAAVMNPNSGYKTY